jgi:hypothetical protein
MIQAHDYIYLSHRCTMQGMSVVAAIADACRRVLRAPVILLGIWLVHLLVPTPVLVERVDVYVALIDAAAMDSTAALLSLVWSNSESLAHAAVTLFLLGGLMDRLARDRAIASFGFFGACGMYFFRFLRLALLAVPIYALLFIVVFPLLPDAPVPAFVWLAPLVLVLHVIFDYAKVRFVVEDRRSAIGALNAALRFVRRHAGAVFALSATNAVIAGATWWLAASFEIGTTAAVYAYIFARVLLRLVFMASLISLFQSRLAHAGYTARPLPAWPDSPAAAALADSPRNRLTRTE